MKDNLFTVSSNLLKAAVRTAAMVFWSIRFMTLKKRPSTIDRSNGRFGSMRTGPLKRWCPERIALNSVTFVSIVMFVICAAIPARAELNYDVDLTQAPYFLQPQAQWDYRWGGFSVGPRNIVQNPSAKINMARCGCWLTSLSTSLRRLNGGSGPYFPSDLFSASGGFINSPTLSPRYIDDYLNFGAGGNRPVGWGFSGGGGAICGVAVWPWAMSGVLNPVRDPVTNDPITPVGVTWDTMQWGSGARQKIDDGLASGVPTGVAIRIPPDPASNFAGGYHANLIVGWDNTEKKYLIIDPMSDPDDPPQLAGQSREGANDNEKYANYIASIKDVYPLIATVNRSFWLYIRDDPEPIELRLTDPRGHRTGYDPVTHNKLQEDQKAFYSDFTSFTDALGIMPEAPPLRYIASRDPEPGLYGLEVFGTGNGPFTLTVGLVNADDPQDSAVLTGNITTGETKRYEITYPGAGLPPTAVSVAAFSPRANAGNDTTAYAGNTVLFDGRGSLQISGSIASYSWAFGDGGTATGATASHAYAAAGTYTATLTVINTDGLSATDTRTVNVVPFGSVVLRETLRVSVGPAGEQADNLSWFGSQITPDARYVAFFSRASNLVTGDTNGLDDVFVKDLVTGAVDRASVSSAGVEANAFSTDPSISADGSTVAFFSGATNLVSGFTGDLYVRNRSTGTTEGIAQTNHLDSRPSLSADGRFLAFSSNTPLLPGASNNAAYVLDRQSNILQVISPFSGADPRISADGRFVAFTGQVGATTGVHVFDRQTAVYEFVSRSPTGTNLAGFDPTVSADARYVSFAFAINTFPAQRNIYVRDRLLATTEQINVGLTNVAYDPAIDSSGRYVTFLNTATGRAYLRDRVAGTTEIISVADDGTQGGVSSFGNFTSSRFAPSVASNGAVVFFTNSVLVPDDSNAVEDVYIRRPVSGSGGAADIPIANLAGPYLGWATSAAVPTGVRLDGSGSIDPAGQPLTGHWNFGDGSAILAAPVVTTHAYASPGIYQVTLTVSSSGGTSVPVHTEVEVLAPLPSSGILAGACSPVAGSVPFDGAFPPANASLIANGWNTSTGPVQTAPVTVVFAWGPVVVPTAMPGLTFAGSTTVPGATGSGSYTASIPGGPFRAFQVPCGTVSNMPPHANAGGPEYAGTPGISVLFNGEASSDPESQSLTYLWNFGDGTSGTGAVPSHTYTYAGTFLVTLIVNDGTQDSTVAIGEHCFALVQVSTAPTAANIAVNGQAITAQGSGIYKVRVTLTDASGTTRTALTNPFGYFRFDDVGAGQTYIISVQSKQYQFGSPAQVLVVSDETSGLVFMALP